MGSIKRNVLAFILWIWGFGFLPGCGGAPEAQHSETQPDPQIEPNRGEKRDVNAFDAASRREFEPLAKSEIRDPNENWTASVEAASPPRVEVDGAGITEITVPVGTDVPIRCVVYNERLDMGAVIGKMIQATGAEVAYEKILGSVAEIVNGAPMLGVNGVYRTDRNGDAQVGMFKLLMYGYPSRSINCFHDEVGYNDSFHRVMRGFFSSFATRDESPAPAYEELWTLHLSGVPIGFSKTTLFENPEGGWTTANQTTTVVPASPTDLSICDDNVVTNSDKTGRILSKKNVSTQNGVLTMSVEIERQKRKNKYSYRGKRRGKPIEGTFTSSNKKGLLDSLVVISRAKRVLAEKKDDALTFELYHPDINPYQPMDVACEIEGTKSPGTLLWRMGQRTVIGTADGQGNLDQLFLPAGAAEVVLKRGFVAGTLPEPN